MRSAKEHGSLAPPKHILNAPTRLMKQEGYGAGYEYDHDATEAFSGQNYFPDDMAREQFYAPDGRGFEAELKKRLEHWAKLRARRDGDAIVGWVKRQRRPNIVHVRGVVLDPGDSSPTSPHFPPFTNATISSLSTRSLVLMA